MTHAFAVGSTVLANVKDYKWQDKPVLIKELRQTEDGIPYYMVSDPEGMHARTIHGQMSLWEHELKTS